MIVVRRRLIFWLIKAYLKKWGKVIALSFVSGLLIFFLFLMLFKYLAPKIHVQKRATIGMIGAYTVDTLPIQITNQIAGGLTRVKPDGTIEPDLAKSWSIRDGGKTYLFSLRRDAYFTNGKPVTAKEITYKFADVKVEKPDDYTVVYKLKDTYAPFLVTVSRPLFTTGIIGAGKYKVSKLELNGNFVKSLRLVSTSNSREAEDYIFYPTQDSLKIAYTLGEITQAEGLTNDTFEETTFETFPHTQVKKMYDYSQLITLFFNTQDKDLSDKKLRSGLTYALPDTFPDGQRAYLPYSPLSIYFNKDITQRAQDFEHAKTLVQTFTDNASSSAVLTITTLPKYHGVADMIIKAWRKIGIKAKVAEVDSIPTNFQMYLGDFSIPKDPDQYTLWHSDQVNNITHYKNLRIDKLLEDGRKTLNVDDRKKIYFDFQKYLVEDSPAAFLYFPFDYQIIRD